MFKIRTGLLVTGLLVAVATIFQPAWSFAETAPTIQRTIDVTGKGTVKAKYDTATITLGVTALKDTAPEAYGAVGEAADSVVQALMKQGVKDEEMKTGQLSLNAEYEWLKEGGQKLKGYRATTTLSVTTQQLDKVAALVQTAVQSGANQLQGVSFSIKDSDAVADAALDRAVDDAKAKAERVAKRLGTAVVGVVRVNVLDGNRGPIMYSDYAAAAPMAKGAESASIPVLGGTAEFSATVSVTFELR